VLAMGRRQDLPSSFAMLNRTQTTPLPAVFLVSLSIILLTLLGDVKTTWSFSAFSVLIYYSITNLATLKLPSQKKKYPTWIALL